RVDGNLFDYTLNHSIDGIAYKAGLDLLTARAMLDLYPFAGGFRLTGGVAYNDNRISATSTPTSPIRIGNETFTPEEVGTLTGKVSYQPVAPFAGFGYSVRLASWLQFSADAGVLYQSGIKVRLTGSSPFASTSLFQTEAHRESQTIASKLGITDFYPVLSLTALIRF
ncbi:MAG TPA: hypothetical protein VKT70_13220, partial [Stellaceae bacterium]|nr:hypothetical protein [Stellaceae bacterium]